MRTRFRTVAAGVAATALVATSVMGMSSATAQEIGDIDNVKVTGDLIVGGNSATLPGGSSASGTLDDLSGDFDLKITVPEATLVVDVDGIGEVSVVYQLRNPQGVQGNIDHDGRVTNASGDFFLDLKSVSLLPGVDMAPCTFGPIEMKFTGGFATVGVLELFDTGFTIPETTDECGDLASIINPVLASQGNTADLVIFLFDDAEVPPTTEPTTTEPTTPAPPATEAPVAAGPAAGAQPVAGTANYTG